MATTEQIKEATDLGIEDAKAGKEPLWYRVGESYVSAESGHIGNTTLGCAYLSGYCSVKVDRPAGDNQS